MKFQSHNDQPVDINFAGLQGYLQATRAELISIFGAARTTGLDDNVNCEWDILFEDGRVATIYNWRKPVPDLHDAHNWSLGGHTRADAQRVHDAYRQGMGSSVRSAQA